MKKLFKDFREITKTKRNQLFLISLLYATIFITAFLLGKLFSALFFQQKNVINPFAFLFIGLVYFLLLLFIYSALKLGILQTALGRKISRKNFNVLGGFFLFNLLTGILAFLAIALVGSFITYSFNDSVIAGAIFLVVFSIFFYPFLFFSQFEFLKTRRIIKSLGIGWNRLFSGNIISYFKLLLFNVLSVAVYFVLFYLIGSLYKMAFIKDNAEPATAILVYNSVFNILLAVLVLFLLSFNVLYFRKIKD